jgi:hypothetical protein
MRICIESCEGKCELKATVHWLACEKVGAFFWCAGSRASGPIHDHTRSQQLIPSPVHSPSTLFPTDWSRRVDRMCSGKFRPGLLTTENPSHLVIQTCSPCVCTRQKGGETGAAGDWWGERRTCARVCVSLLENVPHACTLIFTLSVSVSRGSGAEGTLVC